MIHEINCNENFILFLTECIKRDVEFKKVRKRGKLKFICACGKEITLNGATSHATICNFCYASKIKFIKEYFHFYEFCSLCNKKIEYTHKISIIKDNSICFCGSKCSIAARRLIYEYTFKKECVICNKVFFSNNKNRDTCGISCRNKSASEGIKLWWKNTNNKQTIIDRNKKISVLSKIYNKDRIPWNKNLTGEEYLSHYINDAGENTLLLALKNNKLWFKKTKPERELDTILSDLKLNYKYMIFFNHRQFDFIVWGKKFNLVIEVDGDYWHKSILSCSNTEERKLKRLEDELKNQIIYSLDFERPHYIIRVWESDIKNNKSQIIEYIQNIFKENTDVSHVNNIIQEIKTYYARKS